MEVKVITDKGGNSYLYIDYDETTNEKDKKFKENLLKIPEDMRFNYFNRSGVCYYPDISYIVVGDDYRINVCCFYYNDNLKHKIYIGEDISQRLQSAANDFLFVYEEITKGVNMIDISNKDDKLFITIEIPSGKEKVSKTISIDIGHALLQEKKRLISKYDRALKDLKNEYISLNYSTIAPLPSIVGDFFCSASNTNKVIIGKSFVYRPRYIVNSREGFVYDLGEFAMSIFRDPVTLYASVLLTRTFYDEDSNKLLLQPSNIIDRVGCVSIGMANDLMDERVDISSFIDRFGFNTQTLYNPEGVYYEEYFKDKTFERNTLKKLINAFLTIHLDLPLQNTKLHYYPSIDNIMKYVKENERNIPKITDKDWR